MILLRNNVRNSLRDRSTIVPQTVPQIVSETVPQLIQLDLWDISLSHICRIEDVPQNVVQRTDVPFLARPRVGPSQWDGGPTGHPIFQYLDSRLYCIVLVYLLYYF